MSHDLPPDVANCRPDAEERLAEENTAMPAVSTSYPPPRLRRNRQLRAMAALLIVGMTGVCFWQARSLHSLRATCEAQAAAVRQMQLDAAAIRSLRSAPRRATDRQRANDELLAQVDAALQASGLNREVWQDSVPQPPQRVADQPYTRQTTRLFLEGIALQQLAGLCRELLGTDPTLQLTSLRLTADDRAPSTDPAPPLWRAEIAISYLVYAPVALGGT